MDDAHIGKIRLATHNGLLHSFDGRRRHEDRLHLRFRLQRRRQRDAGRPPAHCRRSRRVDRRQPHVRAASLLEHGFQSYGWKTLFDPPNIDNAPIAEDAKGVTSIRQDVISVECGTGARRARRAKGKGQKAKKPRPNEAAIELKLEPGRS